MKFLMFFKITIYVLDIVSKYLRCKVCKLNEKDLERLLFEIRPLFPNLHTVDVKCNVIVSLRGIEVRTKQMMTSLSSPIRTVITDNNNLRKLNLQENPVFSCAIDDDDVNVDDNNDDDDHDDDGDTVMSNDKARDPKEKAALLTLLDTFKGISNTGVCSSIYELGKVCQRDPEIDYVLRINQAGRKFMLETTAGTGVLVNNNNNSNRTKPITNRALWPSILERAYKNSAEIYDHDDHTSKEVIESKMFSTGLFHMVRNYAYDPIFVEDHTRATTSSTNVTLLPPDTTIATRVKLRRRCHR